MKSTSKEKNLSNSISKTYRKNSNTSNMKVKDLLLKFKKTSRKTLLAKYQTNDNSLNIRMLNDIIYNEKAHVVAVFKDFLIFDDISEFLKRFYKMSETQQRLPKIYEFYESFSKIFANYIILPESKYIYKNIQRKQKMIDNMQNIQNNPVENEKENDQIFNTEIYNSIMNQTTQHDENIQRNLYNTGTRSSANDNNSSLKQNVTKLITQLESCKPSINNSVDSIEILIDSIGKAVSKNSANNDNDFITINSNLSDANGNSTTNEKNSKVNENVKSSKQNIREMNKLHSPTPSLNNPNSLLNNINNFNKAKAISNPANESKKVKPNEPKVISANKKRENTNINQINSYKESIKIIGTVQNFKKSNIKNNKVAEFEKIPITSRGENTDRNNQKSETSRLTMTNFNGNQNHNTIIANSITGKSKNEPNSDTKKLQVGEHSSGNHIQPSVDKPTVVTHKATFSMPKLAVNNMYNNLNLINSYQSELANQVNKNFVVRLTNNKKEAGTPLISENTGSASSIHNNQCKNKDPNNEFSPNHVSIQTRTTSKTLSNKPSERGSLLNTINTQAKHSTRIPPKSSSKEKNKNLKEEQVTIGQKNEPNDYIKTYKSDISKIKKKVSTLVNDSTNNKSTHRSNNQNNNSVLNSKYASVVHLNTNTISVSNSINAHNQSLSKSKNYMNMTKGEKLGRHNDLRTNSLNARPDTNKENSIRAILHRDLFDGEVIINTDRITKKNAVENTKVYTRPESKIRDNFILPNSVEKIWLNNTKEKFSNMNNSNHNKNSFTMNLTDRKVGTHTQNTKLSSPKNIDGNILVNNSYALGTQFIHSKNHSKDNKKNSSENQTDLKGSKNIKKVEGTSSEKVKLINEISIHKNSSHTPNKRNATNTTIHRTVKSNFLVGEGNSNDQIFSKATEAAKKIHDPKFGAQGSNINSNNNTPNSNNKTVIKIKNFYEVVKNGNTPSISNSARTNYNQKNELIINYNRKSTVKEKNIYKL